MFINYLVILFSFILGLSGAVFIRRYGFKLGLSDIPTNRSSHSLVVPKGGGIGFVLGFIVIGFLLNISLFILIPALVISMVSFVGDIRDINPKIRLVIQFLLSLIFLIHMFYQEISFINILVIVLCSIFIVGTSNFYNFMDGIDGIAGITGVVSFFLIAVYGYIYCLDINLIIISMVICVGCLGFLTQNFPKSKVFMGDVGSVFLGFLFSCIVIKLSNSFYDFIALQGFLFFFYMDEITTMAIRLKNRESLLEPHRRHLYQICVNELKISHWKISLCFGFFQLFLGLLIIKMKPFEPVYIICLYVTMFILFLLCSMSIRKKAFKKSFNKM